MPSLWRADKQGSRLQITTDKRYFSFWRNNKHISKEKVSCMSERFYEEVPFLPKYHRMANRLVAYAISSLRGTASMKSIAKNSSLSQHTVTRIFDHVEYLNKDLPRVLSIDEFYGNADREKYGMIM